MDNTRPLDKDGQPKTNYAIGYELGYAVDPPAFQQAYQQYAINDVAATELLAGWKDGIVDSWLHVLRGDLLSLPDVQRAYLQAAIANMVMAFKHKDGGSLPHA